MAEPISLPARRIPATSWRVAASLALPLAPLVLAVAVRLPYLTTEPAWTDETGEALLGLAVAHGHGPQYTNMVAYIGPGWNYLLALGFLVAGPDPFFPRYLTCLLGILAVGLAYQLGATLSGRAGGVVAGALLATSAVAVLIGSHVAWAVSTTPFFYAAMLLCLLRARRDLDGRWLALAGLLLGLGIQMHPAVGTAAPGLLVALLLDRQGRRVLRSRWLALAALLAVLPQLPVLVSEVRNGALGDVLEEHRNVKFALATDPVSLAGRLFALSVQLLRAVSSTLSGVANPLLYLLQPRFDVFAAWLALAVWQAARRGAWLLVLPVVSYALLWGAVNDSYGLLFEARFALFLLPALYALLALPVASLSGRARAPAARAALVALVVALVASPLPALAGYYRSQEAAARTNAVALSAAGALEREAAAGELVALDCALKRPGMGAGNSYLSQLAYVLLLRGRPILTLDLNDRAALRDLARDGPRQLALVARPDDLAKLTPLYAVRPLAADWDSRRRPYGLYRLDRPAGAGGRGAGRRLTPGCAATEDDLRLGLWGAGASPG